MPEDSKVNEIIGKIDQAKAGNIALRDRLLEYYRLYRNWKVTGFKGGRSNIAIPLAFEWVEVVKSRLFDVFFGKRPYIRVKGREPMDDLPAKIVQQYQNYQYDLADYRKLGYDALTQILIYGTAIAKVFWKHEERDMVVDMPIYPDMPEAGTIPSKQRVTTYDNVAFELVDIFDFFIDPEATSIDDARWVAHRTRKTLGYLQDMERRGVYKNVGQVIMSLTEDDSQTEPDQHKDEKSIIEGFMPSRGNMLKPIEIMEYWENDRVITVANGKVIVRDTPNPFRHGKKPFRAGKIISTPHEFYGIGLIEAGAPTAKVMEDLLNSGLDSVNFSTAPMLGVDQTRIDDVELVIRPGGIVHTIGDPNSAMNPLLFPDVSGGVLKFISLIHQLNKQGTGVNDYMIGQTTGGKTATEASLLTSEAAKRIGLHIKIFGLTFVGPVAEMVYELNRQFTTQAQTIRVTNMPEAPFGTIDVTPDIFGAMVDYIWESEDRELNNMVAVQQLMQALGIAQTHPVLAQFIPIIFEKLLEKYDMHENDELKQAAKMAKEMAPVYQQLVMMQMQQQIQTAQAKGGIGNAPKVASRTEGDANQSVNRQVNPSLGNSPV